MPSFMVLVEFIDAHLLKEAFSWLFWHFLGGRFTTKVWLYECLVDVSEFLQSFFIEWLWYFLLAFCYYNLLD